MERTLVIGTGLSAWSVLTSLKDLSGVYIIDGGSGFNHLDVQSKQHLALKGKFGSSHAYASKQELNIADKGGFQLPISLSRGGFSEVWGNGFTPYRFSEIDSSQRISDSDIFQAMTEILSIIPFVHESSELDQRFGRTEMWDAFTASTELPIHSRYADILTRRTASKMKDGYLLGKPGLLLDVKNCTLCGLCLTGCPYGVLFDAGEAINNMILTKRIQSENILTGIVTQIISKTNGLEVVIQVNGATTRLEFDKVIISAGALSTALILMRSGFLPEEFSVPDSQVFYAGYFSKKRFCLEEKRPDIGQVVLYPEIPDKLDFQMSCYAPSDLSRDRISQSIFPNKLSWLKIPKFLSERIVPVIGFLPQQASGYLAITMQNSGFRLERIVNPLTKKAIDQILRRTKSTFKSMGFVSLRPTVIIPDPGSGFHIGGSMPLGGEHVDETGVLIAEPRIRVLDSSILPKVTAGAHSFLTMAVIRHLIRNSQ